MVTAGTPAHLATTHWTAAGMVKPTSRQDTELMRDSYRAELQAFCRVVRAGEPSPVTGADARAALELALTAVASVEQGAPVRLGASEVAHA
jgi:myo-inositol 2-dehydrogenase/D-chiro-inositol 1-dehydrogenase